MPTTPHAASPGVLTIDLDALARNYRLLRDVAAPGHCAAVVKADAYGLGLDAVAARLLAEGCREFFVATLDEGKRLRALIGEDPRIFVLAGAEPGYEAALRESGLRPVLNSLAQIESWIGSGATRADRVIVHIDTGMARLGLAQHEVEELAESPALLSQLGIDFVATHFACADEPEHPLNAEQTTRFNELRSLLPGAKTCLDNSASLLSGVGERGDLTRAGIAVYGGNPFVDRANPVAPVAHLHSPILQVREVRGASTVGYGATHRVEGPARLATVGAGYADGYPRSLGNRAKVFIDGAYAPVVGRVSMDLITIDVTSLPVSSVFPGALVELMGAHVSIDTLASDAGTISYEILTRLGPRWRRDYVGAVRGVRGQ